MKKIAEKSTVDPVKCAHQHLSVREETQRHQDRHNCGYGDTISSKEKDIYATTANDGGKTPSVFQMWGPTTGLGHHEA